MKNRITARIKELIEDHIQRGYCTDEDDAAEELEVENNIAFGEKMFDTGRYMALVNLLRDIEAMGAEV